MSGEQLRVASTGVANSPSLSSGCVATVTTLKPSEPRLDGNEDAREGDKTHLFCTSHGNRKTSRIRPTNANTSAIVSYPTVLYIYILRRRFFPYLFSGAWICIQRRERDKWKYYLGWRTNNILLNDYAHEYDERIATSDRKYFEKTAWANIHATGTITIRDRRDIARIKLDIYIYMVHTIIIKYELH